MKRIIEDLRGLADTFFSGFTSGYQGRSVLSDPRFFPHLILDALLIFFIFFILFSPAIVPLLLAGQFPDQRELLITIGTVFSFVYIIAIVLLVIILLPIGIIKAVRKHRHRKEYAKHRINQNKYRYKTKQR